MVFCRFLRISFIDALCKSPYENCILSSSVILSLKDASWLGGLKPSKNKLESALYMWSTNFDLFMDLIRLEFSVEVVKLVYTWVPWGLFDLLLSYRMLLLLLFEVRFSLLRELPAVSCPRWVCCDIDSEAAVWAFRFGTSLLFWASPPPLLTTIATFLVLAPFLHSLLPTKSSTFGWSRFV